MFKPLFPNIPIGGSRMHLLVHLKKEKKNSMKVSSKKLPGHVANKTSQFINFLFFVDSNK